jgi:predicted dienelactone hydrolase
MPSPAPVPIHARPCTRPTAVAVTGALIGALLTATLSLSAPAAHAALGLTELPASADDGPVTVYYPTAAAELPLSLGQGRLLLSVARDAPPQPGNGRVVMISHGSGGSPWVHADLARALVEAGYTVALPRHAGDHYLDTSSPGPDTWKRRPGEVGRALDRLAADPRFGPHLDTRRVGAYGVSAGGHTVLSLAGGRWSEAGLTRHCEAHLAEDFQACVGLATSLDGGLLDGLKQTLTRWILRWRFSDETPQRHDEPRIAAVVAAVPYAADFDPASLAAPRVPLALATAARDIWLHPRFHSDRILQACSSCEQIAAAPAAGHGAYLSPLPSRLTGLEGRLLNDPPGFDRRDVPALHRRIVAFFDRHLGR